MLQEGDILFIRGHLASPVDDAIKLGETILDKRPFASNYTHCAVYLGGSLITEAQGFRKSGFAGLDRYAGNYDIGKVILSSRERKRFIEALMDEENLPYDWIGIGWLIVFILTGYDHKYKERKRRYCSKYIEWALAKTGIKVNGRTPEDLALDPNVVMERGKG